MSPVQLVTPPTRPLARRARARRSSSALRVPAACPRYRLAGLINAAVRGDGMDDSCEAALAPHTAGVVRAVNALCVVRAAPMALARRFPPEGRTWRGGGFDNAHQAFFNDEKNTG